MLSSPLDLRIEREKEHQEEDTKKKKKRVKSEVKSTLKFCRTVVWKPQKLIITTRIDPNIHINYPNSYTYIQCKNNAHAASLHLLYYAQRKWFFLQQ